MKEVVALRATVLANVRVAESVCVGLGVHYEFDAVVASVAL